jgi:predicted ATPase
MLKRFRVNNFKSLLNFEFRPVGLNLLVGRNNAGKTNLCSALRFVGLSSLTSLENAISTVGEMWNMTNVHVLGKPELEFEVDCALNYEDQSLDFSYILRLNVQKDRIIGREALKVIKETLTVTAGPFKQTPLLENDGHQAKMLHEKRFVQQYQDPHVLTLAPEDTTMLSKLYELEDNPRATLFKRYLRNWFYYSFSPDALRSPDVLRDNPFLRHDGANLSCAMHTLHNEKPRVEKRIIEMLQPIEPNVDLFSYKPPDPDHVYMFLEDEKNHRFGARSMSDGTLRFLAMVYLLVVLEERSKETGIKPLIMIEEPENGLYVGHLKPLLEQIDPSGSGGQFIFTSHNPYVIDLFDNNRDGVHLIKSGKPSSVLAKPDPNKIRSILDQMSLGEMHYREMLA